MSYNSPAAVRTGFITALGVDKAIADKMYDSVIPKFPLGRVGESEDIAKLIAFLASDEASFITGANVLADGGYLYSSTEALKPPPKSN